jgi:hypothetical protein
MSTLILANNGLEAQPVIVEELTGSIPTIDNDHRYLHLGKMFSTFNKSTILAGQTLAFSFKTPSNGYVHYRLAGITPNADSVDTQIFEGATLNAGTGTVLAANNKNRNSALQSEVEMRVAPTFSANGTLLPGFSSYLPGTSGVGQARSGTSGESSTEIVFKPNTVYRFLATNGSSSSNTIGFNFRWYEENGG